MVETINHYASLWLNWQWSMLWQTAILITVVAGIDRLVHKWAWPQLRYALWLLVLVKLILPPTLTSPISVTSTMPVLAKRAMVAPSKTHLRVGSAGIEAFPTPAAVAVIDGTAKAQTLSSTIAESESVSPVLGNVSTAALTLSWHAYAMAVWLLGVLILSAGLVVYLRRLTIEHDEDRPDDVPVWFDKLLTQVSAEVSLRRVPRVIFSNKVCCPAVFGLFRPMLLIPTEQLATVTPEKTRHVLLHELAHIKRGDLFIYAVHMGLVILYWFNPLLWLIRKHMQNLRELCCDATVAGVLGSESGAYRQTLLETGRALLVRPFDPGLGLLGLHENPGWLAVRLDWLQKGPWRRPWLGRALVAAVVAIMLCCVIPMASLRANDGSINECKVTLPNGAMIELVGLYNEKAGRWWCPDGQPLKAGPYEPDMEYLDETNRTEIALRYENLPNGTLGYFGIDRDAEPWLVGMGYITTKEDRQPVKNIARGDLQPEEGTDTISLKVQLAMGNWQTYAHESPRGSWISSSAGEVTFFKPYDRDGRTWMPIAHMLRDCNVRVVAIDVNNVEHESTDRGGGKVWIAGSGGFSHLTAQFDLPLDDIAIIRFQRRPYTKIEFKNVSLVPGQSQNIEIVTTEAKPFPEPKQQIDIAKIRKQSPRYLKAFHAGVMRYLKENNAKELPKRLWPLKRFSLDETSIVEHSHFITSVGYFGPNGFQSLRPEYFRLPMASKTPIMYCKWLLEAEGGKGTNVLFGDGRVEYVKAEELDRLKAAGMSVSN